MCVFMCIHTHTSLVNFVKRNAHALLLALLAHICQVIREEPEENIPFIGVPGVARNTYYFLIKCSHTTVKTPLSVLSFFVCVSKHRNHWTEVGLNIVFK